MAIFALLLFLALSLLSAATAAQNSSSILESDVLTALDNWGKGLVDISIAHDHGEDYVSIAIDFIKSAYNYDNGLVLFKPTLAAEVPFRTTFGGALSYFIGGNSAYPEDKGFALKHWRNASFEIVGIVYDAERAICQTKTLLTNKDGHTVLTYFSMGFTKLASTGALKIDLHHSSLPPTVNDPIKESDVLAALDNWGKGLIDISTAYDHGEDYVTVATDFIKSAYNYENGLVLFKPTLAAEVPFRTTFAGALSYFVSGNSDYPEDVGFALKHWRSVSFEIVGIVYDTNRVTCQTKTTFTNHKGATVIAYFSMAFTRSSSTDELKIDLHHSSLLPTVAIKESDVLAALDSWGKGLIDISTAHDNGEDYVTIAMNVIKSAYNYDNGLVLFKPTLSAEVPFRTTFGGALSYFVGGNSAYPEDKGFALKHWRNVTFEVIGIVYGTDRALVQTKSTFTNSEGGVVVTFFSMGFTKLSSTGELKIDLHHSSLPPASTPSSAAVPQGTSDPSDDESHIDHKLMLAAIVLACVSIVVALLVTIGFILMNNRLMTYSAANKVDPVDQSNLSAGVQMVSPSMEV